MDTGIADMATNPYFESSWTETEMDQELFNDIIIESIKVHGRDFLYLPRTLTNFDEFFGEDAVSAFNDIASVEFYLESTDGWEGEGKFISKFGFELREEATVIVARSRFQEEVTSKFPEITGPRNGDIIIMPPEMDKRVRMFEISHASSESMFYQIGELYVYKVTVRTFEYNGETFNTGLEDVDSYEMDYSVASTIEMESGTGDYEIGEVVSQDNWSAKVVGWNNNNLTVIQTKGILDRESIIVGQESLAAWSIEENVKTNTQDAGAQNNYIRDKESEFVDFSESNPFSGF